MVSARFPAAAQQPPYNRLCDPAYENCRTPLIELIRNETVGIDVGFWFMEDTRYATEPDPQAPGRRAGPGRLRLEAFTVSTTSAPTSR